MHDPAEPADGDQPERGAIVASLNGTIVLRDPNPHDVSRANRPLVPDAPTVVRVEDEIVKALTALGYAVTVRFSRTDK